MNTEHVEVGTDFSDLQLVEIFLHHRVLIVPVVEGRASSSAWSPGPTSSADRTKVHLELGTGSLVRRGGARHARPGLVTLAWMAYDERLASRLREALADADGISEQKMFGGLAVLLHGNMLCGVIGDELMSRLGPELADAALDEPNTRRWTSPAGR